MSYHVYVLRSGTDDQNYVGCTNNLKRRFEEHNSGKVFSTKNRIPLALIYVETHLNRDGAFSREKFLKSGWGKNYLKKVMKNYLHDLQTFSSEKVRKVESKKLGG